MARGFHSVRAMAGFGGMAANAWAPFRYQALADRQWDSQFSDAAAPAPEPEQTRVSRIVSALRDQHAAAGMRLARSYGPLYVEGARIYIDLRAASEEELAKRLAVANARSTRQRDPAARVAALFLQARLDDVRAALQHAATPPQAVKDLSEVPTQERWRVPRVVSYAALGLSALSLLISVFRSRR